jgi:hypothetical protein
VNVEHLRLILFEGANVVDALPVKVRGVEFEAQSLGRHRFKERVPDGGATAEVARFLRGRPVKRHPVFERDFQPALLRLRANRLETLFEEFELPFQSREPSKPLIEATTFTSQRLRDVKNARVGG